MSKRKNGFTLVELMVVIVIIGVLAAVAIPKMMAATNKAKASEGPQMLGAISRMQAVHKAENNFYVSAAIVTTPAAAASSDGWFELGFDQKAYSKYFGFSVTTTADAFTALGTLTAGLGKASAGESLGIDHLDARTYSTELGKLVPNWR